jgi:hypothetical protein
VDSLIHVWIHAFMSGFIDSCVDSCLHEWIPEWGTKNTWRAATTCCRVRGEDWLTRLMRHVDASTGGRALGRRAASDKHHAFTHDPKSIWGLADGRAILSPISRALFNKLHVIGRVSIISPIEMSTILVRKCVLI